MAAKYSIYYGDKALFSAGSKAALVRQLKAEREGWIEIFGDQVPRHTNTHSSFPASYEAIIAKVESEEDDSFLASGLQLAGDPSFAVYPLLGSVEGQTLRALKNDRDAQVCVLIALWIEKGWHEKSQFWQQNEFGADASLGRAILMSGRVQAAFKPGESETASASKARIEREILELEERAEALRQALQSTANDVEGAAKAVKSKFERLKKLNEALTRRAGAKAKKKEVEWQEQFATTHNAYVAQLKFKAPAALWSTAASLHRSSSARAFQVFLGLLIAAGLVAVAGVFVLGDNFAAQFVEDKCLLGTSVCTTGLSVKGPLTAGVLLLVTSMTIWLLRMLNRIHLSERNLAQSAEEKKAFVETYLALVAEGAVSREQEAIVLGAIFRPSADGYVTDDSSSVDISAAAVLAKVMSGR